MESNPAELSEEELKKLHSLLLPGPVVVHMNTDMLQLKNINQK